MYREWPSSIAGAIAWTAESDGTAGPRAPRRVHGPAVDRRPPRGRRARPQRFLSSRRPAPGRRPALRPRPRAVGPRRPGARRARRAGPARRAVAAGRGGAARGAGRRGAERGRRAGGDRGRPRPGPGRRSTRRSPRSCAGPAAASGWPRSRRRSGLSTRQLQRRALDAFGYGPKLLARILRLGDALALARRGVAARRGRGAAAATPTRRTSPTTSGRWPARRSGASASAPGLSRGAGGRAANRSTVLPSGSRTVA